MRRGFAFLFLVWLIPSPCRAELILAPGSRDVVAGARIEATLLLVNDTEAARSADPPVKLTLRARGRGKDALVELHPVASVAEIGMIPARGFLKIPYAGDLPRNLTGDVILDPVDFESPALALHSTDPAGGKAPPGQAETSDVPGSLSDRDAALFASAFSPYEPNYISAGSDGPTNAKFQVSLKFRLFNPNTKTRFLEKFYLAYSQTSIWDLSSNSKPFHDSSYRPSLFYLDDSVSQWPFADSRLGVQAGFEHESNGKDGDSSRSINIAYVRPTLTVPFGSDYFAAFAPKVYTYLDKSDNPDIQEYRGYGDYLVKVGEVDGLQLATTFRKGTRDEAYSLELDLSYPLKKPTFGNLGGYLHLQYFEGYGESMVDYNRKVHPQIRFGLMISR